MADPKKKTKSKWQASDEAYLITAWNDLQATGWTRKDVVLDFSHDPHCSLGYLW